MQTLLQYVFQALDQAQIRYCLLRGYAELDQIETKSDIDLLIDSSQFTQFRILLTGLAFVHVPAWGHAPHQFFVAYDASNDCWLKLDVVTVIAYGQPIHAIHTDLAKQCLQQRQRRVPTWVLAPEHELITLLLHCVLDKGTFAEPRRQRLIELARDLNDTAELAALIQAYWSPRITWQRLAAQITNERWDDLLAARNTITRRLTRQRQLHVVARRVQQRVLRKLDRVAGLLQRRSLTVALLAPDGGGKTTLANELTRTFYLPSRYIYMGSNIEASTVGLPTTRWFQLQSQRPSSPRRLPIWTLARGLRFANSLAEQWYRYATGYYHQVRGRLVLFDRYVYDSQFNTTASLKARMRRWLLAAPAPKPDLVVLLDAPGAVLYARKGEHSPDILEQQRQHYLGMQKHIPGMVIVDATNDAEHVRRTVTSLIWRGYAKYAWHR